MTKGKKYIVFEEDKFIFGKDFSAVDVEKLKEVVTFEDSIIYFGDNYPEDLSYITHFIFSESENTFDSFTLTNDGFFIKDKQKRIVFSNIPLKGFPRKEYDVKKYSYFPFYGTLLFFSGKEILEFERDVEEEYKILNLPSYFLISWYDIHDDTDIFLSFTRNDLDYTGVLINSEKQKIYLPDTLKGSLDQYVKRDFPNNELEFVSYKPIKALNSKNVSADFRLEKDAKILHCQTTTPSFVKNYRRQKLARYLKEQYGENVDCIGTLETGSKSSAELSNYKVVVFSANSSAAPKVAYELKTFYPSTKIIYDRTDYWETFRPEVTMQEAADKIFCSAQFLYDSLPEKYKSKAEVLPNGCDVKPYKKLKKHDRRTAVFCGRDGYKVDWELIFDYAKANPHWDFDIYCFLNVPSESFPENVHLKKFLNEDDLHIEMSKCHLGLSLLKDPEGRASYAQGMLPLKFFHYINSHIQCLMEEITYRNIPEEYKHAAVLADRQNLSLDEIYEKSLSDSEYEELSKLMDWSSRFSKIKAKIDEFLN